MPPHLKADCEPCALRNESAELLRTTGLQTGQVAMGNTRDLDHLRRLGQRTGRETAVIARALMLKLVFRFNVMLCSKPCNPNHATVSGTGKLTLRLCRAATRVVPCRAAWACRRSAKFPGCCLKARSRIGAAGPWPGLHVARALLIRLVSGFGATRLAAFPSWRMAQLSGLLIVVDIAGFNLVMRR